MSPAAGASVTSIASTTYYTPFFVPVTTTFDRIAIRTGGTFSGTGSVRLGIYGSTSGKPSTLILDAGTLSATASNTTYTITISQQLTPGIYFLAGNTQTAATVNTYVGPTSVAASSYIGQPFNSSLLQAIALYSQASVTGAFANAGTLTDLNTSIGMFVFLRAA
jgi:hypothetical protein